MKVSKQKQPMRSNTLEGQEPVGVTKVAKQYTHLPRSLQSITLPSTLTVNTATVTAESRSEGPSKVAGSTQGQAPVGVTKKGGGSNGQHSGFFVSSYLQEGHQLLSSGDKKNTKQGTGQSKPC